MKKSAHHILRVGTAITFLWIGILIFKDPEVWGGYIQPWALALLPMSLKTVMISTAVLDIVVGIFLLVDYFVWLAALIGSFHLLAVLLVAGINAVTIRDIGLLAAAIALVINAWPQKLLPKK